LSKVISDVLSIAPWTSLNLSSDSSADSYVPCDRMKAEEAKDITDVLKTNTTLTELDLFGMDCFKE